MLKNQSFQAFFMLSGCSIFVEAFYDLFSLQFIQIIIFLMSRLNYSKIPDGDYELQEKHVEDISQVMTSIFLRKNEVWSKAGLDLQKLKPFFINRITEHIELQNKRKAQLGKHLALNTIWIDKGRLAGCLLNYDIEDYQKLLSKNEKSEIPLFQKLEDIGANLFKNIDLEAFQTGKCFYSNFGFNQVHSTKDDLTKSQQLVEHYLAFKNQGYRFMFARSSNMRVWPIYEGAGAQIKSQVSLNFGKREFTIYLISLDMENPKFVQLASEVREYWAKRAIQRPKL